MKHKFKTWLAVALLLALSGGVATFAEEDPYREKKQRTSWLADFGFGTMHHFLIYPPGKTEQEKSEGMNRIVDGFDVQAFMNDFDRSGADWLIFTIGQNSSYYCAPNSVLDERLPGHTSRRDLIQEIGSEVKKRNKRFILYLPAETRHNTPEMELIRRAFGWKPGDQSEFRTRYTAFIREYSERYGTMVDGWWFDGSQVDRSVFGDFSEWLAACRAGNPGAIVAFNPGPALKEFGEHEDYMAGEIFELPPPFRFAQSGGRSLSPSTIPVPARGMKRAFSSAADCAIFLNKRKQQQVKNEQTDSLSSWISSLAFGLERAVRGHAGF